MTGYDEYRSNMSEAAGKYEDFVYTQLFHMLGVCVVPYKSRFFQLNVGENGGGIEIKQDHKMASTGNLWIETAEKARPRDGDYVRAGIFKAEMPWLYVIGDYKCIYVFGTQNLINLIGKRSYVEKENNTGTSKGFLLDRAMAEYTAAAVLHPIVSADSIGKVTNHWKTRNKP